MKQLISCEFNIDTACVELYFTDESRISIDCTAVENEVADNRFQRSELDWLIYNDPIAYADLVLNGDPKRYLKSVTAYKQYKTIGYTSTSATTYRMHWCFTFVK